MGGKKERKERRKERKEGKKGMGVNPDRAQIKVTHSEMFAASSVYIGNQKDRFFSETVIMTCVRPISL